MTKRVVVIIVALAAAAACQEAVRTSATTQSNTIQFGNMIAELGFNRSDYWSYGCYCGSGNAGEDKVPIDATDACCQDHDACWGDAPRGCDCAWATYTWEEEAGSIGCIPTGNACADYCCACDRDATNCFSRNRDTWNRNCTGYDRSICSAAGPPDCCGDSDCDVGEVCFRGECFPICGGDGSGSDGGGSGGDGSGSGSGSGSNGSGSGVHPTANAIIRVCVSPSEVAAAAR